MLVLSYDPCIYVTSVYSKIIYLDLVFFKMTMKWSIKNGLIFGTKYRCNISVSMYSQLKPWCVSYWPILTTNINHHYKTYPTFNN